MANQNSIFENGFIEFIKKIEHVNRIEDKYVDKLHTMSSQERKSLIERIIQKYDSDEYVNKEYRLGREPKRSLFNILYKYAVVHGVEIDTENESVFCCGHYIIDSEFVLRIYHGQGCFIRVEHVGEE